MSLTIEKRTELGRMCRELVKTARTKSGCVGFMDRMAKAIAKMFSTFGVTDDSPLGLAWDLIGGKNFNTAMVVIGAVGDCDADPLALAQWLAREADRSENGECPPPTCLFDTLARLDAGLGLGLPGCLMFACLPSGKTARTYEVPIRVTCDAVLRVRADNLSRAVELAVEATKAASPLEGHHVFTMDGSSMEYALGRDPVGAVIRSVSDGFLANRGRMGGFEATLSRLGFSLLDRDGEPSMEMCLTDGNDEAFMVMSGIGGLIRCRLRPASDRERLIRDVSASGDQASGVVIGYSPAGGLVEDPGQEAVLEIEVAGRSYREGAEFAKPVRVVYEIFGLAGDIVSAMEREGLAGGCGISLGGLSGKLTGLDRDPLLLSMTRAEFPTDGDHAPLMAVLCVGGGNRTVADEEFPYPPGSRKLVLADGDVVLVSGDNRLAEGQGEIRVTIPGGDVSACRTEVVDGGRTTLVEEGKLADFGRSLALLWSSRE